MNRCLLSVMLSMTLAGCHLPDNTALNNEVEAVIEANNLSGDPMAGRDIPDINSAKAQLGMRLFFSKSLSGDQDTACVSCHHPMLGGGDALSLPIGVAAQDPDLLGPGRLHDSAAAHYDGGPTVPRNAPTTFNIAAWDAVLFHDGRLESLGKTAGANGNDNQGIRTPDASFGQADNLSGTDLPQAQARFPITSPEEMKGFNHDDKDNQAIRDYLASRLGGYGDGAGELADSAYWLALFREAYDDPTASAEELITEQNIAELISIYERSQSFVDTPWKRFIDGDVLALSPDAKRGALLFFRTPAEGGAGCADCHSGDFFTDEQFHNIAMPQLGRGKGDGDDGSEDFGRFRETGDEADKFAFRTPSLINVAATGPWGHAGAYTTLEAVVRHYLGPEAAVYNFDFDQLDQPGIQNQDTMIAMTQQALDKLAAERSAGTSKLPVITLSDDQVDQLVAFLEALTDPCVEDRECLSPWIPDPADNPDPNGHQLSARNAAGGLL